ncbi:MAG: glycine zipper 2TM domain-containing protein [Betaproteobacteria bacterium]|nr:glycine zipper 2TM domain-containing protein [Betaproteobacteria bacterium]
MRRATLPARNHTGGFDEHPRCQRRHFPHGRPPRHRRRSRRRRRLRGRRCGLLPGPPARPGRQVFHDPDEHGRARAAGRRGSRCRSPTRARRHGTGTCRGDRTKAGTRCRRSRARAPPAPAPEPAAAVPAPKPAPPPAPVKPRVARPAPAPAPAAARPAPSTPSYATAPAYAPSAPPPAVAAPESAPAPRLCRDCGTVSEVIPIEKKGESSGAGAVLGGIVGGVLGHQVGGGRGKDVATVAGALGGALVGNEMEKGRATIVAWNVRVRLEDGTNKVVRYTAEPSWRVGDKVRIENGRIVSASRP